MCGITWSTRWTPRKRSINLRALMSVIFGKVLSP
jgi:hypothetical protein